MATTKAAKKTTKANTNASTRDAFGSRDGSVSHAINAVIIAAKGRAVSVDTIVEKSGASRTRVTAHMRWLMERDHIEEKGDGYKTKAKAKRTTKKTK